MKAITNVKKYIFFEFKIEDSSCGPFIQLRFTYIINFLNVVVPRRDRALNLLTHKIEIILGSSVVCVWEACDRNDIPTIAHSFVCLSL